MRMMNRWLIVAVLVALLGGAWTWQSRVPADAVAALREPAPAVGHPAPDFEAPLLGGDSFSLAAARGTPVVLNFWATWCGPCRNEMPALENAAQRYEGKVAFLGVDQGEDAATIQGFLDELGLTFPIALDEDQAVGADLYNVTGLPTTYFIDGEGTIRRVWMGEMNSITLEEGIAEILR